VRHSLGEILLVSTLILSKKPILGYCNLFFRLIKK
jgi:hypothetical protein